MDSDSSSDGDGFSLLEQFIATAQSDDEKPLDYKAAKNAKKQAKNQQDGEVNKGKDKQDEKPKKEDKPEDNSRANKEGKEDDNGKKKDEGEEKKDDKDDTDDAADDSDDKRSTVPSRAADSPDTLASTLPVTEDGGITATPTRNDLYSDAGPKSSKNAAYNEHQQRMLSATGYGSRAMSRGGRVSTATSRPPSSFSAIVRQPSVYSLFMAKNKVYYFQHPWFRIFVAVCVTFCNFLIFAEDPVSHSFSEANVPVVGHVYSFMAIRWPSHVEWLAAKICLILVAIFFGMLVGKFFFHKLLFGRLLRLKMFADDQGSWMIMFLSTVLSLFIFSIVYNFLLELDSPHTDAYHASAYMGITNVTFMKAAACGTWLGDFVTAWMVIDIMLQEKLYPHWAQCMRRFWLRGYNRIIFFWMATISVTTGVYLVILTDWVDWDAYSPDILKTNELSRAILAAFILVMDILIVMQDWDFPHFENDMDIKLPGLNTAQINITLPACIRDWSVHISGKWFNYGIIFIVMGLDLNMWKNQIFYAPVDYGQYIHPDTNKIYSATDEASYTNLNATILDYNFRQATLSADGSNLTLLQRDIFSNSRYLGFALPIKAVAFVPCIIAFVAFAVLVCKFGRALPKDQKGFYGGRLKVRKKTLPGGTEVGARPPGKNSVSPAMSPVPEGGEISPLPGQTKPSVPLNTRPRDVWI